MNLVEMRPLDQRIRERSYEPWCRGLKSLFTHPKRGQKRGPFRGRNIVIGIADAELWNLVFKKGPLPKMILGTPESKQHIRV
jgi:hypothetical protein